MFLSRIGVSHAPVGSSPSAGFTCGPHISTDPTRCARTRVQHDLRMLPPTRTIRPSPVELLVVRDEGPAGVRLRSDPGYTRIRSGIYAATAAWRVLRPWDRYLARVHAYAVRNPGAVFCHESAAALLGLPVFGEPRDIHVFDPRRSRSLRFGDVSVHTSQDPREIDDSGPVTVTSIADTVIDLARVLPPAFGLATIDAAIGGGQGHPSIDALRQRSQSQSARRGRLRLPWLWENADGLAESPGESVSRAVIAWWGFERPELQVEFGHEGADDRVDFFWRARSVIGESDGYGKYDADAPGDAKRILLAEKTREDRLRRHVGAVARWDWKDAMRGRPVRDRLQGAGLVQVRPPQFAMLATLRTHPRSFSPAELRARRPSPPVRNGGTAET